MLPPDEKIMRALLALDNYDTTKRISNFIGRRDDEVRSALRNLERHGFVEATKGGRGLRLWWRVTEIGRAWLDNMETGK